MDSESYLENLTDAELDTTNGGLLPIVLSAVNLAIYGFPGYQSYRLSTLIWSKLSQAGMPLIYKICNFT